MLIGDGLIRAAPDAAAPVLVKTTDVMYLGLPMDQGGVPDGWQRITFIREEADKGLWPPCGYVTGF